MRYLFKYETSILICINSLQLIQIQIKDMRAFQIVLDYIYILLINSNVWKKN